MAGAVLYWECVRTSRRRSRWLLRASYLAVVFGLLGVSWQNSAMTRNERITAQAIRDLLVSFHGALAICQLQAALLLGPVFAAGAVIEERLGRTLLFILTSRAGAAEFMTGKLCAALLRVSDVVLCGLPFYVICVLLGSIPAETVLAELILAMSATAAASALALFVAAWCRRVVDSLVFTYLVQGLWYSLPAFSFIGVLVGRWPTVPGTVLHWNALRATRDLATVPPGLWWDTWAVPAAVMLGCAAAFWVAAVLTFRYAFRRLEFGVVRGPTQIGRRRWGVAVVHRARAVGDRPMLWRELRSRRATLVERATWTVFVAAGLIVLGLIARAWPASVQAVAAPASSGPPPRVCIISGAATFCYLAFLAFPFLAVAGATGFADEREGRVYELLRLTDLEQSELVHAKLARLAILALILLVPPVLLTGITCVIGYSSWANLLLVPLNCLASFAFAATLGLAMSLRTSRTNHAVAATIAVGLMGGFLIPFLSVLSVKSGPSSAQYLFATMSPPLQCFFLMMFDTARGGVGPAAPISIPTMRTLALAWTSAYGLASFGLYLVSLCGENLRRTPVPLISWLREERSLR